MELTWEDSLKLLVPALVTVCGWFIGAWRSRKAAEASERRKRNLDYLIEAFLLIEAAAFRAPTADNKRFRDGLERAAALINLYGSPSQIAAFEASLKGTNSGGLSSTGDLLKVLRQDLRTQLELPPVAEDFMSMRPFNKEWDEFVAGAEHPNATGPSPGVKRVGD